ncbi:MAG: hypothetical protein V2A53_00175 [bacterium]
MQTRETLKELVDFLPDDKTEIAFSFLQWLKGESLAASEMELIKKGEEEIAEGKYIRWRNVRKV